MLALTPAANAAIAFDAAAGGTAVNMTSLSFSMTVGSLTDGIMVCGVSTNDNGSYSVTSFTYNSVALTQIASLDVTGFHPIVYYWLASPAAGTNTVNIKLSNSFHIVTASCASYSGASQSPPPAFSSTSGGTSLTLTLTTAKDNSWLSAIGTDASGDPMSAAAGTTLRGPAGGGLQLADTNAPVHPAGAASVIYAADSTTKGIVVEIDPAVHSSGGSQILEF